MCTERLDDLPRQQRALGAAGGRLQPRLPEHCAGLRPAAGEPGPRAVAVQLQHRLHHADQTRVRRSSKLDLKHLVSTSTAQAELHAGPALPRLLRGVRRPADDQRLLRPDQHLLLRRAHLPQARGNHTTEIHGSSLVIRALNS